MNPRRIPAVLCAAVAALLPLPLLAQVNTTPLVPVPPVWTSQPASTTGPITAMQPGASITQPGVIATQPGMQFGAQPGVITTQPGIVTTQPGVIVQPNTVAPAPVITGPPAIPNMPPPPAGAFGGPVYDPYGQTLPGAVSPQPAILGAPLLPGGTNWNSFGSTAGITPRVGGGTLLGEDVGLDDAMSWFQGFMPVFQVPGQNITFIDARAIKFHENTGAYGFNFEGGYRWFSPASNRIYGGYVGYDYRNNGFSEFDQIAFGGESLGPLWDVRANGYLLLSSDTSFISLTNLRYEGMNLVGTANYFDAYSGFDAEIGRNLTPASPTTDLRVFGGGYGFFSQGSPDAWGVRGRIEATWWDRVSVGGSVQYDEVFNTTFNLTVSVLFGGANHANPCGCPTITDRLGDPLHKNMQVVVGRRAERTLINNPADNMPWQILHIDSNEAAGGDGTFETPYNTLATAEAGNNANIDILLAHAGSVFTDEQIDMTFPDQRLLGDSDTVPHTVDSQFGTLTLPRANALAAKPIINGPLNNIGSAITVSANDVEVSGWNIIGPDDHGIFVDQVTGFNINRNMISGADSNLLGTGDGIFVDIAGIAGATGTISENMVSGGNVNGIEVSGAGGTFAGTIENNASNGNLLDGFFISELAGGTVSGNTANGNGANGFNFTTVSSGTISNNSAAGNTVDGFNFMTFAGGSLTNNTATANTVDGFNLISFTGGAVSLNNAFLNASDGFEIGSENDGVVVGTWSAGALNNNTSNFNALFGFRVNNRIGGTAAGNTAASNGVDNTVPP